MFISNSIEKQVSYHKLFHLYLYFYYLLEPTFKQADSEPKYESKYEPINSPDNWAENSPLSARLGEEQILQRRNDEIKIEDISASDEKIKKARDILPSSEALKSGT